MRRVLVISPVVSHGRGQGNSARIVAVAEMLRRAGCALHYFHVRTEGPTQPAATRAMRDFWDLYVPTNWWPQAMHTKKQPPFLIDDWIDQKNFNPLEELLRTYEYDAVVVNYVWMSGFLPVVERILPDCVRVIDTHDRFGDRDVELLRSGLQPSWYYTSQQEEARGLARAQIRIAIQHHERCYFERIVNQPCHLVRHAPRFTRVAPRDVRLPLRVGYLASDNVLNRVSLAAFYAAVDAQGKDVPFDLLLAGPISLLNESARPYSRSVGFIDDVREFYERVDVVINPMIGGTGLKIKTVEALAHGVPVLSTSDGSFGMNIDLPALNLRNPRALAGMLFRLSHDTAQFAAFSAEVSDAYLAYESHVREEEHVLVRAMFGVDQATPVSVELLPSAFDAVSGNLRLAAKQPAVDLPAPPSKDAQPNEPVASSVSDIEPVATATAVRPHGAGRFDFPLDSCVTGHGWYELEAEEGASWRWSGPGCSADLTLPRLFDGIVRVEVTFSSLVAGMMPPDGGITIDGRQVNAILDLATDGLSGVIRFDFDFSFLKRDVFTMEFRLARTPVDGYSLGLSDVRALGICLRKLTFDANVQ